MRPALALGVLFFLVYNANGRESPSGDSQAAKFAAVTLARRHLLTLDGVVGRQQAYGDRPAFARDRAGHWRNAYPLPPVLEAAAVATILRAVGALHLDAPGAPATVAKLTASFFAALAGVFAFLTARRFCGTPAAAFVATGFALGTGVWPLASQTLWQHATAIWSAMAAVWLWSAGDRPGLRRLLLIGALLGWSVSARPQTAPMMIVLAAGLLHRASGRQRLAGALAFIAPIAVFAGLNVLWFGDPRGAWPEIDRVNQSLHAVRTRWQWPGPGLIGLLFSPSRGLIVFSPIVLVALVALRRPSEGRPLVRWTLAAAAAQLLFYSSYSVWWAGFTYGPRYCLDLLPALVPAAAVGMARLAQARAWVRLLAAAALIWSLVTSATGAFCYPHDVWNVDPESVNLAHGRLWDVRDSQILRCWSRGLSPQNFALLERTAWRREEKP